MPKKTTKLPKGTTYKPGYRALMDIIKNTKKSYAGTRWEEKYTPGILASFLVEHFVFGCTEFRAVPVVERGFCVKNQFTKWRDFQESLGILEVKKEMNGEREHVIVTPGPKIKHALEEIRVSCGLLPATQEQVANVNARVDTLEERVGRLENALDTLIEAGDPPTSAAKREKYTKHPDQLAKRLSVVKGGRE